MAIFDAPLGNGATDVKFQICLNSVGCGSFNILESKLKELYPDAAEQDIFRIKLFGTYVFSFIWEDTQHTEQDNGDFILTISGGGIANQLDRIPLYPDRNTSKYKTTDNTFKYDETFNITYPYVQGIYLRTENNLRNLGTSVGQVWNKLIGAATDTASDANYENVIHPQFFGIGTNDAASQAWDDFSPTGFSFEIGNSYLSILNDMADKSFLFYRQEETQALTVNGNIYLYKSTTPFNSIDVNAESKRFRNFTYNTSIKDKYNGFLVLDKNVITSYRNPQVDGVIGTIAMEYSNNPNLHAKMTQNFVNQDNTTKSIQMVLQPGKLNACVDFTVGDRLVLDGKLNNNRILSITVEVSNDVEAHIATFELGTDQPTDTNPNFSIKRDFGLNLNQKVKQLQRKANPTTSTVTAANISSDGKRVQATNSDGTTSTLQITDAAIIINGVSIPKGVLS